MSDQSHEENRGEATVVIVRCPELVSAVEEGFVSIAAAIRELTEQMRLYNKGPQPDLFAGDKHRG